MLGTITYQKNKISKLEVENSELTINQQAYINIIGGNIRENVVLKLSKVDLKNSKDKLIQRIDSTRNALKIAKNDLKQASGITTIINDTILIEIPIDTTTCDFNIKKIVNTETTIEIIRSEQSLTIIPDIKNTQYLYITDKERYRNRRKNWFDRLFHWDWKKDKYQEYKIENSNDLIKVEDVRVIRINDQ